jgi:hypothetical protein
MRIPPGSANASNRARDVDPIAKNVIRFGNHVTEVDPDPKGDALVFNRFRIAVSHPALDLDGTPDGVDHAWKFREQTVARVLDHTTAVLLDLRIDQFPEMRLQPLVRALLISAHQTRITGYISGQDRG